MPKDPNLAAEQARAQRDNIEALQVQMQGDTAALMARYGTRLALAASTGTAPASAAPAPILGPR
jgi:hypothetical protein